MPPGSGTVNWADVERALYKHRLEKGLEPDPDAPVSAQVTITKPGRLVTNSELPRAAKALAIRLESAGWTVQAIKSETHKTATLYMEDAPEDSKLGYKRGDERYPAKDRSHYELRGRKGEVPYCIGVRASWTQEEGGPCKPDWGWYYDPYVGMVFEKTFGGLNTLLDIVVPKPESKKKPAKAAEKAGHVANEKEAGLLMGLDWQ